MTVKRTRSVIHMDPADQAEVQAFADDLGISFSAAGRIVVRTGLRSLRAADEQAAQQEKGEKS